MLGCNTVHYLLERSRVIAQATGERNYHILYQMCAGMSDEQLAALHLRPASTFRILNPELQAGTAGDASDGTGAARGAGAGGDGPDGGGDGGVWDLDAGDGANMIDGVDDGADWHETLAALHVMCGTDSDPDGDVGGDLWRVLAAVLHLGDVLLQDDGSGFARIAEASAAPAAHDDVVGLVDVVVDMSPVACAAELLQVDASALSRALVSKVFASGRGSTANIQLTVVQVSVGAVARACAAVGAVYRRKRGPDARTPPPPHHHCCPGASNGGCPGQVLVRPPVQLVGAPSERVDTARGGA